MMKFRGRPQADVPAAPNTVIGVGSSFRGTLMVAGTLRIDGEFEGDILNCERLEIGEHGSIRADVEVREAVVHGSVVGSIRALGTIELRAGSKVEGDVAAVTVGIEPGVYFTGRCTMLDSGGGSVDMAGDPRRRDDKP